jgi:hypothetical protein
MIINNKADTILLSNKKPYPLRPLFVAKNEQKQTLIVSVEPGTIVDLNALEEYSVLDERRLFELKVGESLCILADVYFPERIASGNIQGYEYDEESDKKEVTIGGYKIYLNRYNIQGFRIVQTNEKDLEKLKNYLVLCYYSPPNPLDVTDTGFREVVFYDDINTAFNQMYVEGFMSFRQGIIVPKDAEDEYELPQPDENEDLGELIYFFAWQYEAPITTTTPPP